MVDGALKKLSMPVNRRARVLHVALSHLWVGRTLDAAVPVRSLGGAVRVGSIRGPYRWAAVVSRDGCGNLAPVRPVASENGSPKARGLVVSSLRIVQDEWMSDEMSEWYAVRILSRYSPSELEYIETHPDGHPHDIAILKPVVDWVNAQPHPVKQRIGRKYKKKRMGRVAYYLARGLGFE